MAGGGVVPGAAVSRIDDERQQWLDGRQADRDRAIGRARDALDALNTSGLEATIEITYPTVGLIRAFEDPEPLTVTLPECPPQEEPCDGDTA